MFYKLTLVLWSNKYLKILAGFSVSLISTFWMQYTLQWHFQNSTNLLILVTESRPRVDVKFESMRCAAFSSSFIPKCRETRYVYDYLILIAIGFEIWYSMGLLTVALGCEKRRYTSRLYDHHVPGRFQQLVWPKRLGKSYRSLSTLQCKIDRIDKRA